MVAVPSCVTARSLALLNELQQPRLLYVITPVPHLCHRHLASQAANVRCVNESAVVPGLNREVVTQVLAQHYPNLDGETFEMGRSPSGWYLQQVRSGHQAADVSTLADLHCDAKPSLQPSLPCLVRSRPEDGVVSSACVVTQQNRISSERGHVQACSC